MSGMRNIWNYGCCLVCLGMSVVMTTGGAVAAEAAGGKATENLAAAGTDGWKLDLQGGATGEMTVAKAAGKDGKDGLTVNADLSGEAAKNGTYAAVTYSFENLKATSIDVISFNIKTDNVTKLTLRLVDATGQIFQRRPMLTADGQLHGITIEPAEWKKSEHFGGANDGVIHQPLKAVAISMPKGCSADGKPVITITDIIATLTR